MKSILIAIFSLALINSPAMALETEGTVEEIRVCGSGINPSSWVNFTYVRMSDGSWFHLYTNSGAGDFDDNQSYSLVMSAYVSNLKVKVKATTPVSGASVPSCGLTTKPTVGFRSKNGDYIALVKD